MALDPRVVEKVSRQVDALRDWITDTTVRLVRIPTVNPYSGDESAGRETAGQVELARLLEAMGGQARTVAVPDDVFARCGVLGPSPRDYTDRYNVVGSFRLGSGGRSILLNCHMDTVGTAGYHGDPFSGEVTDGRIYGRGSTDSKGNLVVGLAAIKALQAGGLAVNGDVIFESVVDEECNGSGGGTLANRLAGITADACIALDGSDLYPCTGCSGVTTAAIDVYGRGGHAARGAVNAIDKAVKIKLAIDGLAENRQSMVPPQMMNLGIFKAGTLPAVVPDRAHLEYNIAYSLAEAQASQQAGKGWGAALLMEQFEQVVRMPANGDPWLRDHPPAVTWIKDLYPFETPHDAPIVRAAIEAYGAVLGEAKDPAPMGAWFDGAHIAVYGRIPIVGMGAGTGEAAHAQTEWIVIDDQVANAKAVALAMYAHLTGAA